MTIYKSTDEVGLIHELARHTVFNVHYHERELRKAHQRVAAAKSLMKRASFHIEAAEAKRSYNEDEDGDDVRSSGDLVRHIYGDALSSLDYHEEWLNRAHQELAGVKAILSRGNYTGISLDEMERAEIARLEKADE